MMERLSDRFMYYAGLLAGAGVGVEDLKHIQDLIDLEEQGLLLRLPYDIENCGILYYVDERDCEIYRLQADNIRVSKMMISNRFIYEVDCFEFFYEDFGKIVFTTKAEAEQALKKMEGE